MRKLILGGIVFVLMLVGWVLFLEREKRQFEESLPKLPAPTQHVNKVPTHAEKPENLAPDEPEVEVLEDIHETPAAVPEKIRDTETTDSVFEDEIVEQIQEPEAAGLSPELEALFSEYAPLQEAISEVSKVLGPLIDRHHWGSDRIRDILLRELPVSADGPERQALHAEIDEIHAWKESVKEQTFELQDERQRLSNELSALLAKYGISSWREFHHIHGDTYNAWKAEQ